MPIQLPNWLKRLRGSEIVQAVRNDPRSSTDRPFLGYTKCQALKAIGGGQAPFDEPWGCLSPDDRVLLYCFFNQRGHLEELIEAFGQLFENGPPDGEPIVADLGCGPFTGGLALAGALGPETAFDYIGVDISQTMREFGERQATAAEAFEEMPDVRRHWTADLSSFSWPRPPGWRPVIVIVSYLLASRTLDVKTLVGELRDLLSKLSAGPTMLLYTNSDREDANRSFPVFRDELRGLGFELRADDSGQIVVERQSAAKPRQLRYALFRRSARTTLRL